jgi:hypothetical protein
MGIKRSNVEWLNGQMAKWLSLEQCTTYPSSLYSATI